MKNKNKNKHSNVGSRWGPPKSKYKAHLGFAFKMLCACSFVCLYVVGRWLVVSSVGRWRFKTLRATTSAPVTTTCWIWSVRKTWLQDSQSVTPSGWPAASTNCRPSHSPPTPTGHSTHFTAAYYFSCIIYFRYCDRASLLVRWFFGSFLRYGGCDFSKTTGWPKNGTIFCTP